MGCSVDYWRGENLGMEDEGKGLGNGELRRELLENERLGRKKSRNEVLREERLREDGVSCGMKVCW